MDFSDSDKKLSNELECELIGDYDFKTVTNFEEAVTAFKKIDESTSVDHVPMYIYLTPFHEISNKISFKTKKLVNDISGTAIQQTTDVISYLSKAIADLEFLTRTAGDGKMVSYGQTLLKVTNR